MKYLPVFFISLLFVSIVLPSCKNEDCVSVANNYLLVDFFTVDTLENGTIDINPKDTIFYSVTGVGTDSVFYKRGKKVSSLTLPVNPSADQTEFQLVMLDSVRYLPSSTNPSVLDTIYYVHDKLQIVKVSYDRRYRVIAEECGMEISYHNITVDAITFPYSALKSNYLSRLNEVNIEVYF